MKVIDSTVEEVEDDNVDTSLQDALKEIVQSNNKLGELIVTVANKPTPVQKVTVETSPHRRKKFRVTVIRDRNNLIKSMEVEEL